MLSKRGTTNRSATSLTQRMASNDGRLAFVLSSALRGVYVERVEALPPSGAICHSMLVAKIGDFARFLETDSARFEEPGLYRSVQSRVEEMLYAGA